MTVSFNQLPKDLQAQIAETFAGLEEAEAWRDAVDAKATEEPSSRPVGFSDLYAFAKDPSSDATGRIRAEMRRNSRLAASFSALLDDLNAFSFDTLAAAAAGDVLERSNPDKGYNLTLIESTAEPGEFHIVIKLDDALGTSFQSLYLMGTNGEVEVLPLETGEMPIHILLERESPALHLLKRHDTELKFL